VRTFNPLFPRLFRESLILVPANLYEIMPTLRLSPLSDLTFDFGWDFSWRESLQDGVYTGPLILLPRTANSPGRAIGNQLIFDAAWRPNPHLTLAASYIHFFAGDTIRQAGGSDMDYVAATVTLRF
jgi:hypothetical protein